MAIHRRVEVSEVKEKGVTVVRFVDRKILDEANIQELGQELFKLIEEEKRTSLLLNFTNVEFLSSAALGKLITLDKKVKAHGGKLKFCNIRPEIYEVFAITKLNKLFDIKEDEAAALAAFYVGLPIDVSQPLENRLHLAAPLFLQLAIPHEAIWGIAGVAAVVALLLVIRFFARRAKDGAIPAVDLRIDVSALSAAPPSPDPPRLEFYNVPVRLAAVVLAPTGRAGDVPSLDKLHALIDQIVPGLGGVFQRDKPLIRRWPPQMSVHGFAHTFFAHVPLPGDRGKGTPWCSLAGRFEASEKRYLIGLVLCSAANNSLGQTIVERDNQWLDMLRIRS